MQYCHPLGNCQGKLLWDTASPQPQWHHQQLWQQMAEEMWEKGTLIHCWWAVQINEDIVKIITEISQKLKKKIPNNLAIVLLAIYPKNFLSYRRSICTHTLLMLHSPHQKIGVSLVMSCGMDIKGKTTQHWTIKAKCRNWLSVECIKVNREIQSWKEK